MIHVKIFENFLDNEQIDVMLKILPVINEPWFIKGEDAPDEFIEEFSDLTVEDSILQSMIDISTSGPGLTDVWIERGELIYDVLEEPSVDVTEEEIEDSNRKWFVTARKDIKSHVLSTISPEEINKRIEKSPEETVLWLKKVWKSANFSEIKKQLKIPESLKKELETLSDLYELGF